MRRGWLLPVGVAAAVLLAVLIRKEYPALRRYVKMERM